MLLHRGTPLLHISKKARDPNYPVWRAVSLWWLMLLTTCVRVRVSSTAPGSRLPTTVGNTLRSTEDDGGSPVIPHNSITLRRSNSSSAISQFLTNMGLPSNPQDAAPAYDDVFGDHPANRFTASGSTSAVSDINLGSSLHEGASLTPCSVCSSGARRRRRTPRPRS
jgi:hypothetical protein